MAIINFRANTDDPSVALRYYAIGALANPGLLCLLGSRMFINLIDAGQSEVKNGSDNGIQSGRESIISDIQFGDPSGPHSSKYILRH